MPLSCPNDSFTTPTYMATIMLRYVTRVSSSSHDPYLRPTRLHIARVQTQNYNKTLLENFYLEFGYLDEINKIHKLMFSRTKQAVTITKYVWPKVTLALSTCECVANSQAKALYVGVRLHTRKILILKK